MAALRFPAHVLVVVLLAGTGTGHYVSAPPQFLGDLERIQGRWEVRSVRKDGRDDPTQIGAVLKFVGNEVIFFANVRQFADGTS
jgi:hypothetical protein